MVQSTTKITYISNGTTYKESVTVGNSVLNPTTFTPTKTDATFKGWSTSSSSTTVQTSLNATTTPITLYAVFKYNDASVPRLGGNAFETLFSVTYDGNKYSKITFTYKIGVWSGALFAGLYITESGTGTKVFNRHITVGEYDNQSGSANFSVGRTYTLSNNGSKDENDEGGWRSGIYSGTLTGRTVVG